MTVTSTEPSITLLPTVGRLRLPRVRPAMLASAVALGAASAALPAVAQQTTGDQPATLPAISVEGQKPGAAASEGYKASESASPKFTAPLLDTPKTVTVITKELMEDHGATSLTEVYRTTPGISLGAGEGGTAIGDRPFIRGYDSTSSTYIDGIRDTGSQSRDIFDVEQVEIIKGPSSTFGGRGSTGGAINLITKSAKSEDFNAGSVTLGTDLTKRATVDINRVIDANTAFRINAMAHDADVAGRDEVDITKFGFAPTISLGMQKPTRLTLSYYHFQSEDLPDYGIPIDPSTGKPIDVDRDNFYGSTDRDYRKTYYDGVTAQVEHDLTDSVLLRNSTRYSYAENRYIVTEPRVTTANLAAGTVTLSPKSRNADTETITNQTDLQSEFNALGFGHTLITGIEISREQTKNRAYAFSPTSTTGSLYDPDSGVSGLAVSTSPNFANTTIDTKAIYAIDTIALASQWDLNIGLRLDDYSTDSVGRNNSGAFDLTNNSRFLNPQVGLVYKPLPNGSIYVAYSTSSNPSGGSAGEGGGDGSLGVTNATLDPEENKSYELGTKWELANGKLLVNGAAFRTDKTNAAVPGVSNTVDQLPVGKERVDGFEIGLSGAITQAWKVFGGYTFLKSEILDDGPNASNDGKEFPNIAPHNFTLWSTYDIDSDWTIGGGTVYMARRFSNTTNTVELPSYWRFDAMAAYKITRDVNVQLNLQNLLDKTYYDAPRGGNAAIVAPGRTALLTANFKF
ncbi:TonB-dependent receptor [Ferrovibrio xuzhouensis]|uniref:TonB-dependent receptor n=1 Tax=Ferrovibrio xuzhouensis TaxID=1576914 RepID=A0ABV7VDT3_9PROT